MRWIHLSVAILLEVAGTLLMKRSEGFAHVGTGALALVSYGVCLVFLGLALKSIPIAVAYAIWSGMGIAIVSALGWALFDEPLSTSRIFFLALIAVACIGLQLTELQAPSP